MHELSIANGLLEAAAAEARRHEATRILRLDCRIGCLRQVDQGLLTEAFELARTNTLADTAELAVTYVGMHLASRPCGYEADLDGWQFECPQCGSTEINLTGGDELELTSLQLEIPDED